MDMAHSDIWLESFKYPHIRGHDVPQYVDISIKVDADNKPLAISSVQIPHFRRLDTDIPLSSVETKSFASVNSSVGCVDIPVSPFCAECPSIIQPRAPLATISHNCA